MLPIFKPLAEQITKVYKNPIQIVLKESQNLFEDKTFRAQIFNNYLLKWNKTARIRAKP